MIDERPDDDDELEPLPTEQPSVDAASVRALRKRETKRQIAERESVTFWRAVFGSDIGRREMWGLLQATHAFETVFACGPNGFPQSEATWFKAGEQSVGQRLHQSWFKVAREGVMLMHDEYDPRFADSKKKREE